MWKTVAKTTLVCTVLPGLTVYKDRLAAAAGLTAYKDRPVEAEEMTFSLYPDTLMSVGTRSMGI